MKSIIKLFSSFLLCMFLTCTTACSSNNDDDDPEAPVQSSYAVSKISYSNGLTLSFMYDDNDRLIQMISNDNGIKREFKYVWTDNKVSIQDLATINGKNYYHLTEVKLNNFGLASEVSDFYENYNASISENFNYTYDSNKRLKKLVVDAHNLNTTETYTYTYTLQWDDNLLKGYEYVGIMDADKVTCNVTFKYLESTPNLGGLSMDLAGAFGFCPPQLFYAGLIGSPVPMLPEKTIQNYYLSWYGNITNNMDFTYSMDSNDLIVGVYNGFDTDKNATISYIKK